METVFAVIVIIAVIAIVVFVKKKKNEKIQTLKNAYDEALRGTDKQRAVAAGRAYYGSLRKDSAPTIYDETAITNDVSAMKV
jgi:hypothetical protein